MPSTVRTRSPTDSTELADGHDVVAFDEWHESVDREPEFARRERAAGRDVVDLRPDRLFEGVETGLDPSDPQRRCRCRGCDGRVTDDRSARVVEESAVRPFEVRPDPVATLPSDGHHPPPAQGVVPEQSLDRRRPGPPGHRPDEQQGAAVALESLERLAERSLLVIGVGADDVHGWFEPGPSIS
jgi:hypothetical protein